MKYHAWTIDYDTGSSVCEDCQVTVSYEDILDLGLSSNEVIRWGELDIVVAVREQVGTPRQEAPEEDEDVGAGEPGDTTETPIIFYIPTKCKECDGPHY